MVNLNVVVGKRGPTDNYCAGHTCNVDGCGNKLVVYNGCCKLHNCEFPECVNHARGKPYCPEHTCNNIVKTYIPVYHMNRPSVFTLCAQHACQFPSCGTLVCDQGKVTCAAIVHYGRDLELYRQTYCVKYFTIFY